MSAIQDLFVRNIVCALFSQFATGVAVNVRIQVVAVNCVAVSLRCLYSGFKSLRASKHVKYVHLVSKILMIIVVSRACGLQTRKIRTPGLQDPYD